jgi:predicted NAD/FAD-dependent oxidoreductase
MPNTCLIVGAGMAGLIAARTLQAAGWQVTVVDKGSQPGGRMATRRLGDGGVSDHGAQFLTVRDGAFAQAVREWERAAVVRPWFTVEGHTRYRGAEGMNGIARYLAEGLDVQTGVRLGQISIEGTGWLAVSDEGQEFRADTLILTPPAPQTLALCEDFASEAVVAALRSIRFDPCLALLCALDGPSRIPAPGYIRPWLGPLSWIADNRQKGISAVTAITLHGDAEFSRKHWDTPDDEVSRMMLEAAEEWLGVPVSGWQLHRWRYSQPAAATRGNRCLYGDAPAPYSIAGDAFGGPRVEGAFLSGLAAAERILHG